MIHHLDMSRNEAWTGTEQMRIWKIEGNILTYTTARAKNPLDGNEVVHTVKSSGRPESTNNRKQPSPCPPWGQTRSFGDVRVMSAYHPKLTAKAEIH
jgi:hypothetical protein